MPLVSILVPAFRPDYLDVCLASALAQTLRDFELIVSDDSSGTDVEQIAARWADPRLRYVRNPNRGRLGANRDFLIGEARGKYLKFLFDDDFLLPSSLELLVAAGEGLGAKLAFHGRYVVDGAGRLLDARMALRSGQVGLLAPGTVFDQLVGTGFNFIGEPSNVLIEAAALAAIEQPFAVAGELMRFLTDVALYVNFADQAMAIAGIGHLGSGFRRHGAQTSAAGSPLFSAGLFEWELLARWCADRGHLRPEAAQHAISTAHTSYAPHLAAFPELASFLTLGCEPDEQGHYLHAAFRGALAYARQLVDERFQASRHSVEAGPAPQLVLANGRQ